MGMDTAGIKAENACGQSWRTEKHGTEGGCQKGAGRIRFPKFKTFI